MLWLLGGKLSCDVLWYILSWALAEDIELKWKKVSKITTKMNVKFSCVFGKKKISDILLPGYMGSLATSIHVFLWGFSVLKIFNDPNSQSVHSQCMSHFWSRGSVIHLSQLASTSSLFPLKQEAGDEKVSHICKMQPRALLIVSFSLEEEKCDWTFLFLLLECVDCLD